MAGSIAGTVADIRNLQPIPNAQLQLTPSGGSQSTNDNGEFTFGGLAAGTDCELTALAQGYDQGIYGPLVVVDGVTTTLALVLSPEYG